MIYKVINDDYTELTSVLILDIIRGHIDPFHLLNLVLILCIIVYMGWI